MQNQHPNELVVQNPNAPTCVSFIQLWQFHPNKKI